MSTGRLLTETDMKIINVFKNIIIILLVISFLFVVAMTVFGFKGYSVVTDSMSPTIKRGYVVFTKEISFDELKVGDIITVKLGNNGETFTHRVVEIDRENDSFFTKGDNSETRDGASEAKNIIGKVIFSLPLVGYISIAVSDTVVLTVIIGVIVVLSAAMRIFLRIYQKKKGETENEQIKES